MESVLIYSNHLHIWDQLTAVISKHFAKPTSPIQIKKFTFNSMQSSQTGPKSVIYIPVRPDLYIWQRVIHLRNPSLLRGITGLTSTTSEAYGDRGKEPTGKKPLEYVILVNIDLIKQ